MTERILFASSYTNMGGGETATLTLAEQLVHHGYAPHLFVAGEGALAAAWRDHDWPVHLKVYRGATTYFIPAVWAQFPLVRTLERMIRENQIDVIHSDYHTLPWALPAARRAGIPCVWTCMGWWFRPKWWQREFFRGVDVVFAHSEAIKRGFLGRAPFMPPESIEITYPGVDTVRFNPRVDGSAVREQIGAEGCQVVVMVGRFQSVKGHETFIQMAARVLQRLPRTHFIIAGENIQSGRDSGYKQRILERVGRSRRMSTRIHFLGHRNDVEVVMAAADVVVTPSHFESFGVVNVEAMAAGKPVVSTNRGGPTETVVDGVTGFLVPPKDPDAMATRVIELLYSDDTRRSFGTAGRMRAQQVFSADAVAERFAARVGALLPQRDD
ncbi:MAG: glycosyltransferase family 4 protein [Chloroflexota bacterium]